jgi:hypothetical protein
MITIVLLIFSNIHLYDRRVVWPLEIPECAAVEGHTHQLGTAFFDTAFKSRPTVLAAIPSTPPSLKQSRKLSLSWCFQGFRFGI